MKHNSMRDYALNDYKEETTSDAMFLFMFIFPFAFAGTIEFWSL